MTEISASRVISIGSAPAISKESKWLQAPAVTPDNINSLTATLGCVQLCVWLPDPKDPRDVSVWETWDQSMLVEEGPSVSCLSSLSRVLEAGEAWGSSTNWLVLPQYCGVTFARDLRAASRSCNYCLSQESFSLNTLILYSDIWRIFEGPLLSVPDLVNFTSFSFLVFGLPLKTYTED